MSAAIAPAPASAGSSGGSSSTPSSSGGAAGAPPPAAASTPASQQGQGSAPASDGTTQGAAAAAAAKAKLKRKEKINGKEVELEATEDELFAAYRHQRSIHENARKVAEEKKALAAEKAQLEELKRLRREDPFHDFRQEEGFNELEFLTERLQRTLQDETGDERDRKIKQLTQQLTAKERAEQQARQRAEQEQAEAEDRKTLQQLGARFLGAFQRAKLPQNDLLLDMMAKAHFTAEDSELELSEDELVRDTIKTTGESLDGLLDAMDDDQVLDLFPKASKRIAKAALARIKKLQASGSITAAQPPRPAQAPTQEKRLTEAELHRKREEEAGRRLMRY